MKSNKVNLSGLDLTKAENAAIIKTFETLVPNYDREQVYVSDMRKLMKWYVILEPMLDFSAAEAEAAPAAEAASTAATAEAKPAKAAAPKKPKAPKKD
jgi:hypothetical protein